MSMIQGTILALAGLAFLILIIGAAFSYHDDENCQDPDYPCHFDDSDYDDLTPMCEEECDAKGEFGECSKCGWVDHLAQSKVDWPKDDDGAPYDPAHTCVVDDWGLCVTCDKLVGVK